MEKITEKKFEPTLDEPKSDLALGYQDKFEKTMKKNQVQFEEVDKMLNEKEQSLKKKIFDLAKMESLVHADPKLSAVYNEMAENGEEKYGYHYNETIMNMIFNDYVLNSSKYLQKYKMAIPKEKKRRDKSGINQLKKSGKKKQDATGTTIVEPDLNESLEQMKEKAQQISKEEGVAQHVNELPNGVFNVSDWYDSENTVASYENGQQLNENKEEEIDETTGAASSGAYVGPAVWGSGDLMKGGKKQKKDKKSFWDGGVMIQESKTNYLVNPEGFEEFFNHLNEGHVINEEMITDLKLLGRKVTKEDIPNLAGQALYDIAIALANKMMPLSWSDFGDTNSMWDYIDENGGMSLDELKTSVKEAVEDRMSNDDFPTDLMEHHATTREEKIDTILQILNSQDDGSAVGAEEFENMSDVALDQTYQDIERMAGIAEQQLSEDHLQGKDQKIRFIQQQLGDSMPVDVLQDMSDEDIDVLYDEMESAENLDEKAKSKAQQRFMGMVHAFQKGELKPSEVGDKVEKAAASMTDKETEDFAATKHKGLPEKVKENVEVENWEGTDVDLETSLGEYGFVAHQPENKDYPDEWFVLYKINEDAYGTGWIREAELNNIVAGKDWADQEDVQGFLSFVGSDFDTWFQTPFINKLSNLLKYWGHQDIMGSDYSPISKEEAFAKINNNEIEENSMTMIDQQEDSMAMKPPVNTSQGGVETGMNSAMGGMNEELKKMNAELALYEMHQKELKKMSEEKKHGAMVLKDRLGKENEKNFKSDLKHSGTKEIIDTSKELEWKDQQTDVPSDPQKLRKDIEKTELKNTKGEAFKDEGNSANNEGDEIPKRNLTDEETDEVDLYRKGLGDFVFDNKPDERFEERMERDMGEKNYKMRKKRMEFYADAPMYNKDSQPVEDGIEKVQFDKEKSGWNERMGIKESTGMSGKYVDELGVTRFFDFNINEVWELVDEGALPYLTELNLDGLGNTYDSKVQVNEGIVNIISSHKFYTNGTDVFALKNPVQNLMESEHKKVKRPVNEQFNKMQHLLGYNPKDFTNTKNIKL